MSALLTRQTTALAATEIFLSAGKIKSEWPPNKRVMTRFSCRLTSGEAIATRDASAKALEPVTVSADVVCQQQRNRKYSSSPQITCTHTRFLNHRTNAA